MEAVVKLVEEEIPLEIDEIHGYVSTVQGQTACNQLMCVPEQFAAATLELLKSSHRQHKQLHLFETFAGQKDCMDNMLQSVQLTHVRFQALNTRLNCRKRAVYNCNITITGNKFCTHSVRVGRARAKGNGKSKGKDTDA
eukprot:6370840-Amphidinium_carterae.2